MTKAVIVSGGNIQKDFALDFLKRTMNKRENQKIQLVAADKGLEFFENTGYLPDIIIGDFDSLTDQGQLFYESLKGEKKQPEMIRLKPEKDDSDTQAAVNLCIARGAQEILIFGATGNRVDHFMANIGLLVYGKENNIRIEMADAYNYICLVENGAILKKSEQFGKYVSFFPLDGEVLELSLQGFRYSLEKYTLKTADSGLTVSNEIIEEEARITYKKGTLLMIMSRDTLDTGRISC